MGRCLRYCCNCRRKCRAGYLSKKLLPVCARALCVGTAGGLCGGARDCRRSDNKDIGRQKPRGSGAFTFCARVCKPSSVWNSNLSGPRIAVRLKRHSAVARGTALHSGKDFAVSPELNRFVTVRTSYARKKRTTGVTCYLATLVAQSECSDFPPQSFD